MGHPDQFAKQTFADETERVTGGAVTWQDPPEIGLIKLVKVQGDGLLRVRNRAGLGGLPAPWCEAREHVEMLVELKMPGDHVDLLAVERAVLRQQALWVQQLEGSKAQERSEANEGKTVAPPGAVPLWLTAPHVPRWLRRARPLRTVGAGCYALGPSWRPTLWIAANELPLVEELVPFLVARSGRALDEFARWVAPRRPLDWVLSMVEYTTMSTDVSEELLRRFAWVDDPKIEARRQKILQALLEASPHVKEQLIERGVAQGLERGVAQGLTQGRIVTARSALLRVLTLRGLPITPEEHARIEACTDPATLERWHDQAVTSSSTAQALQ